MGLKRVESGTASGSFDLDGRTDVASSNAMLTPRPAGSAAIAPWPKFSENRRDLFAFIAGFLLPAGIFAGLAAATAHREPGWDAALIRLAERYYAPSVAEPVEQALKVSMVAGAAIAVGVVIVLLTRKRWVHALLWVLAVGGGALLELLLKEIFQRPSLGGRPGYSFPSGNAMVAVAILAAVALTCPARWRKFVVAVGVPVIILYGAALVYQYWHYPSDVMGGWCIALAWVTLVWLALRRGTREYSG